MILGENGIRGTKSLASCCATPVFSRARATANDEAIIMTSRILDALLTIIVTK